MPIAWSESLDDVDWNELAELYRVAPLGNKTPQGLHGAFGNSMFRCFAREEGRLVGGRRPRGEGGGRTKHWNNTGQPSPQRTGQRKPKLGRQRQRAPRPKKKKQ